MTIVAREPAQGQEVAPRAGITSGQLVLTFVPFGLGLIVAMLYPELSENLRLYRTIYSVRVSLVLAAPALALFPFRSRSPGVRNSWRLFWTFSFLAYLVHFAYAWFGVFGSQVETARLHPDLFHVPEEPTALDLVIAHQGAFVTYSNFALTGLWLVDVIAAWIFGGWGRARPVASALHWLTWLYVLVSFVIATIVFGKNPVILALGWALVAVVVLSLLLRALIRLRAGVATNGADRAGLTQTGGAP